MGLRPALNVCHAWLCHLLGVPVASAGTGRKGEKPGSRVAGLIWRGKCGMGRGVRELK